MGNRIKLPNIDFAKAGDGIGRLAKDVAKFVGNHREKFLGGGLLDKAGNIVSQVMENYADRKESDIFAALAKQVMRRFLEW